MGTVGIWEETKSYIEGSLPELFVVLLLGGRHVRIQDDLLLGRQAGLHIRLDAPQQKRLQDGVQLTQHL